MGGERRGESPPRSCTVEPAASVREGTRLDDEEGVALQGVTGVRRRRWERMSVRSSMRSLPKSLTR